MGLTWMDAEEPLMASAGWSTLASVVALQPDDQLPLRTVEELLEILKVTLQAAPNRVRHTMNNFVIAVGCAM